MPILRLDPAHPLLWRDAETVQFGIDAILTLPLPGPWAERLLSELRSGFPSISFDVVAHRCGASRAEARALRERLGPVLQAAETETRAVRLEADDGFDPAAVLRIGEALHDAGIAILGTDPGPHSGSVSGSVSEPDAPLLLLAQGVASAAAASRHLSDDRPHLPVAFDPAGTTVGPLVVPGLTPCLSCRDGHDRDHDPAWAAVHSQMLRRSPGRIPLRRLSAAADTVAQLLAERPDATRHGSSRIVRISGDGRRASRAVRFHEECRCRSLPETATVAARTVRTPATTTSSEFARRA
ncbi:hypothetical protein J2Y69_000101 [Microbacterium resistens]|uniref:Bacteriocin biosynthesis cyclodehydratase domain-containing protein n=1 Tax=Microbacterium resistens TaxID=156977 RepID=A0ABU1S7C4_9MICO|nr:hypothetical protein [Microbacterium resistens]